MSNETEQQPLWTVEDEIEASIKPCPKCGGKAVIEKFDEVVCLECGLWSGDEWESLEYAVDWWNKQPLIDDLRAQVAALTAELEAAREWQPVKRGDLTDFLEQGALVEADESTLCVYRNGVGAQVDLPENIKLCKRKEGAA